MSILLDNQEFIKKWKEENKLNQENAIDHLMTFIKYNGKLENMVEEIEFIGDHFEEFENMLEFDKIPPKYLNELFKKAKGIKSEKNILIYNLELLKKENNKYYRKYIIESIEIKGLNHNEMKGLIDNIKYDELTEKLFSAFKEYIHIYDKQGKKFEFNEKDIMNNQKEISERQIELITRKKFNRKEGRTKPKS